MKNGQMTLVGSGFEKYAKTTRRAQFLAEMEAVMPWGELCALIEPSYPKAGMATCTSTGNESDAATPSCSSAWRGRSRL